MFITNIIKLTVLLLQISFSPSVLQVATLIADTLPGIVDSMRLLPRLCDKFHIPKEDTVKFCDVIDSDEDCVKLQTALDNGIS